MTATLVGMALIIVGLLLGGPAGAVATLILFLTLGQHPPQA